MRMPLRSSGPFEPAAEPAPHRWAGVAGEEGPHAEGAVELVPERLAVAQLDPGLMLDRPEPERHRGEEAGRRDLALPVERGGVAHLDRAVRDGVEDRERRHDLAGREEVDLQATRRPSR